MTASKSQFPERVCVFSAAKEISRLIYHHAFAKLNFKWRQQIIICLNFDKHTTVFAVIVGASIALFNGCTVNVNQPNANTANVGTTSPQKSPTSTPAAPEPRRTSLFDEEFLLKPGASREFRFTIPQGERTARLEGGLRVRENKRIDVYIYPAADFSESADKSRKSIHLVQVKNEKIDERLERGDYVLVFENTSPGEIVTVAAEFFLVFD